MLQKYQSFVTFFIMYLLYNKYNVIYKNVYITLFKYKFLGLFIGGKYMNESVKNEMSIFTKILIGIILIATTAILVHFMFPWESENVEEINSLKVDEDVYFKQGEQIVCIKECKNQTLFLYSRKDNKKVGSKTLDKFKITSSDESIAVPSVNAANIRVKLKKEGIVTITAKYEDTIASIKLIVISDRQIMSVNGRNFKHDSKITIKKGQKVQLKAVLPEIFQDYGNITYKLAYNTAQTAKYSEFLNLNSETGEVEALKRTSKKIKIVAKFNGISVACIKISVSNSTTSVPDEFEILEEVAFKGDEFSFIQYNKAFKFSLLNKNSKKVISDSIYDYFNVYSSDDSIAKVDMRKKALIFNKEGTVTLTAKNKLSGQEASIVVSSYKTPISFSFNGMEYKSGSKVKMKLGEEADISMLLPDEALQNVRYELYSDKYSSYVELDEIIGKVRALKKGNVSISAKINNIVISKIFINIT